MKKIIDSNIKGKTKMEAEIYPQNIKYGIVIKDNDFAEIGHCFRCEIEGDKVTIHNDMSWWAVTIPIEQFQDEFKEMRKEDYEIYIEACDEGEDQVSEAVIKKYLD